MPFSASKSASAARASIREEKRKKEQEEELKEKEAKMKKDKFYNERMMMAALRLFTPKQMKEHGITIIYSPEDPNATPRSPNYMRPTTASARHRVAKGGRRTRKRRNGKKKTMRKGGRMRKGGMRRRRYSSRNKRGGQPVLLITFPIDLDIFDLDMKLSDRFSIIPQKQGDGSVKPYLQHNKNELDEDHRITSILFKLMIDKETCSISYELDIVLVMVNEVEKTNVTISVKISKDQAEDLFTKMNKKDILDGFIRDAMIELGPECSHDGLMHKYEKKNQ
jgi:hypothetical protein